MQPFAADTYSAERAIKSNNSNVLTIGAFTTGSGSSQTDRKDLDGSKMATRNSF